MDKNAILEALHDLGFRYKKNEYGAYDFTFESYTYMLTLDEDDDTFVNVCVPCIYSVEDEQYRPVILEIINEIHATMKISKVILVKDSVWVNYEFRLIDGMDVEKALRLAIMNLLAVTEKFTAKVNGGGLPQIGE